jgi:hypothetical protein
MLIPNIKNHKLINCIVIVLLVYIFTVGITKVTSNMQVKTVDKPLIIWENQVCNIKAERCHIKLDNSNLSLAFTPKLLTYKHPINIELMLPAANYEKVTAEFIGKAMSMGLFPFKLKPINVTGTEQLFSGVGHIVFCTIDPKMKWMLRLRITSNNKVDQLDIDLDY